MPRLIVDRSGRRKTPPCGRLIEYREAHSPFQKLIDAERKRYGLSGRELAERIGVSQSTLWIWLHNLNGYPHPKAFKQIHLQRLSRILKVPESKIRAALDASRHLFTPTEDPTPHKSFEALGHFIQIIENDKRTTVSRKYVLNIAKNLYRGAKVTLLMLSATLLLAATSRADEPQTFVTTKGERFEKARVTEITPATITIIHAAGVARLPLADFPLDIQKRFGYDEAKAKAWIAAETARAEQAELERRQKEAKQGRDRGTKETVDAMAHYLDDGGHLQMDRRTGRIYDPNVEAARRAAAIEYWQRYGHRDRP